MLRIDPEGKPFVLLDSPFQEIRALRFDDKGALYVGVRRTAVRPADRRRQPTTAAAIRPPASGAPRQSRRFPSRPRSPRSRSSIPRAGGIDGSPRRSARRRRAAVYRIDPDGVWDQLWESRDDSPYDLTFDRTGAPRSSAPAARARYIGSTAIPLRPTLLARASAQQVTAFYKDARGRLYYATANPGKVFRLSSERAARGTYESEPRDAQMIATWGTLSWRGTTPGGNRIELFTRSGNTATPDETWSAWSAAYTNADGSPITSPKTRYLQWRAVLTGKADGPVLTSVTAAYLQRNLRPQVRSVTVHPPGIVFQKPFPPASRSSPASTNRPRPSASWPRPRRSRAAANALGRRAYQKGLETLQWRADDENDDELVYDMLYRREGESSWKALRGASRRRFSSGTRIPSRTARIS